MLGRTLSLAAVTLFVAWVAIPAGRAQAQNLDAGKSPSQLFAGTCNACHRSPRGLLKTVSAGSLPGFLRQHYTTSGEMASQLSSFLIANGASDARSRQGSDTKPAAGSDQVDRQGRNARRPVPAAEGPDATRSGEGQTVPAQAGSDRGPDGRRLSAKQRLGKRSKPAAEDAPSAREESQKLEPAIDDKVNADIPKEDVGKSEPPKASEQGKAEAARIEAPKEGGGETSALRADPAPPAAPAPPVGSREPAGAASSGSPEPAPANVSVAPAAARPAAATPASGPASAVTASAPPPAPAGPPVPPISQ